MHFNTREKKYSCAKREGNNSRRNKPRNNLKERGTVAACHPLLYENFKEVNTLCVELVYVTIISCVPF